MFLIALLSLQRILRSALWQSSNPQGFFPRPSFLSIRHPGSPNWISGSHRALFNSSKPSLCPAGCPRAERAIFPTLRCLFDGPQPAVTSSPFCHDLWPLTIDPCQQRPICLWLETEMGQLAGRKGLWEGGHRCRIWPVAHTRCVCTLSLALSSSVGGQVGGGWCV